MALTMSQIWEHFLEAEDDEALELELPSYEAAEEVKKAFSVYKSRMLKDEAVRSIFGEMRIKYVITSVASTGPWILAISIDMEPKIRTYDVKLKGA